MTTKLAGSIKVGASQREGGALPVMRSRLHATCSNSTPLVIAQSNECLAGLVSAQITGTDAVVVVDSNLRTPTDAEIFLSGRKVFIYAATQNEQKQRALEQCGATVTCLPELTADSAPTGRVDLAAMLLDLGQREINELHVEAGHGLNGSLIANGLVDELLIYLAPKLLGHGRDMANFGPITGLEQALQLDFKSTSLIGPDLCLLARVRGRDVF